MSPQTFSLGLTIVLAIAWEQAASAQQIKFRLPENDPNTNSDLIRSAALSPDGSLLAVGYGRFVGLLQEPRPGQTVLWEVRSGKRKASFVARIDGVCSVAFSPDGKTLASAEYPGIVRLWSIPTVRDCLEIKAPAWVSGAIAFSPDSKLLAVGLWTGATDGVSPRGNDVVLWDSASGKLVLTFKGHSNGVRALGFSPDGKFLVSGSMDGTAKVWDVSNGALQATLESPSLRKRLGRDLSIDVASIAFAPDGRTLVMSAGSKAEGVGEVSLWIAPSGPIRTTLRGLEGFVDQVAFSPDGKFLLTAGSGQSIQFWNTSSLQEVGKARGTSPIAFSLDGKELVRSTAGAITIQKLADVIPAEGTGAATLPGSR